MNNLFIQQRFQMHSGGFSDFKIECDALRETDLDTLAFLISRKFSFGGVYGIPRGGVALQKALEKYITPENKTFLLVDDVFTTGGSMFEAKDKILADVTAQGFEKLQGVVLFARGKMPDWIQSVLHLDPLFWQND
ncbi:hypothetical protein QJU43_06275 [Pasteurella atlantica]|uniref:Phosphoribosyltransferase domain-containing protein n=1 Tax=Pasteurella atlantica TaxID=2827233 RepID=A0AAW8CRK1_9PAST|nr:hypothetical protein [Pasteurella atlantica]MBR0574349.1 hypothetical protein [Pasteurella atlantica]MDP8033736.1 hypothetical protein [Pasteurella atlantica]MDP8035671.1 hypothetical protein [Pasteurella atlantica]MDP8037648.1 hypothetical protein [Pasteurella atlantica]MDP8040268.1 hypothetical protein [Pasteurella atlantica]